MRAFFQKWLPFGWYLRIAFGPRTPGILTTWIDARYVNDGIQNVGQIGKRSGIDVMIVARCHTLRGACNMFERGLKKEKEQDEHIWKSN